MEDYIYVSFVIVAWSCYTIEYGKTIKQGHLSLEGNIFTFFLLDVFLDIFQLLHILFIFLVCVPGSAPTFLVFADMCGRAWRITSSTPQRCRPLLKPTFFSVEEIRLCKVFLPDLAILIHRRGSIEVSRNPRSNFTFLWRPALTHIHVRDHNKVVCCCVFQKNFSKNIFFLFPPPPPPQWEIGANNFESLNCFLIWSTPLSATLRAPSGNYPDRSFNYITLWSS